MLLNRTAPAALALHLLLASSCGSATETSQHPPIEHGAQLYEKYCAFCHGEEGDGYTSDNANALAHPDFLRIASDEFLAKSIRYGRPGTPMSAWGPEKAGPLDDTDIEHLVAFIRTWQTADPTDVDGYTLDANASKTRGSSYYAAYKCDECHGELGLGGEYMTIENPWFLSAVSDGYLREAIAHGRAGTPMTGYRDSLTALEMDDLISLIRSWERDPNDDPIPPYDPDLTNAISHPDGADPDFQLKDGRFIGVDAVKFAQDNGAKMILLDARPHADFVDGHITDSVSIPFYDLERVIDDLPTDVWIINYCGCPHAVSGQSFDALKAAGFNKTAVLDEGYYVWVEREYPNEAGE